MKKAIVIFGESSATAFKELIFEFSAGKGFEAVFFFSVADAAAQNQINMEDKIVFFCPIRISDVTDAAKLYPKNKKCTLINSPHWEDVEKVKKVGAFFEIKGEVFSEFAEKFLTD